MAVAATVLATESIAAASMAQWQEAAVSQAQRRREASQYTACSVDIYLVNERRWEEVLLDTGAARSIMPALKLARTAIRSGTRTIALKLYGASGETVVDDPEVTETPFKFSLDGPTHRVEMILGGQGTLSILGTDFWAGKQADISFSKRTVTLPGGEVVPFKASRKSAAAMAAATEKQPITARVATEVKLRPGKATQVKCQLSNVPPQLSQADLFVAAQTTTGIGISSSDEGRTAARLHDSLTRVEWHPKQGWVATILVENPTNDWRLLTKGDAVASLEYLDLETDGDVRCLQDFEVTSSP